MSENKRKIEMFDNGRCKMFMDAVDKTITFECLPDYAPTLSEDGLLRFKKIFEVIEK